MTLPTCTDVNYITVTYFLCSSDFAIYHSGYLTDFDPTLFLSIGTLVQNDIA